MSATTTTTTTAARSRFEDFPVKYLKGVGEVRAKQLKEELEIDSVRDLLDHFPFRYVDRSRFYMISEFAGEMPQIQVRGHFLNFSVEGEGKSQRLRATFTDTSRMMEVVWFAGIKKIREMYQPMTEYVLFGKPTQYNGAWQMAHPEVERYDPQRPPTGFQGIYSMTDTMRKRGMGQRVFQKIMSTLLEHPRYGEIAETLPAPIISELHYPSIRDAYRQLHIPDNPDRLRKSRERMKFEELFYLELQILRYSKRRNHQLAGHVFSRIGQYFNRFYSDHIPFELTGAQKRVLKEIRADMRTGRQMNRLLQGDVGSGKTLVAFMTMLMSADNGFQSCLMAPTEILAGQHYETLRAWGEKIGLRVELLTGSTRAKARREIHAGLLSGDVDMIVGTHALLEEKVEFRNLGLAVIDEQHRFGVAQRARMWAKGKVPPHVLVMTATPIPRTLAMTVYGDLEVSVIDELPPGRKPIETWLRYDTSRAEVDRHIWRQLQEGRQIYIVYPLIKENEKLDLKSLEEGLERTRQTFPGVEISFVHGKMKPAEKDWQMQKFVEGQSRIMVATTVIEVGVNVPNATVMVIENAERFGLSQLHQLRGRVGRGADRSWCILMSKSKMSATTRKRLHIMTETTDGFLISEADMKIRGPGDMEGTQQSGIAFELKIADLTRDGQIVALAREMAQRVLAGNPQIAGVPADDAASGSIQPMPLDAGSLAILASELHRRFSKKIDWSLIS
ncbi:MAG: ATP-dependent DNA helicase RecG [Muribaculaceae bacterium]|nr:ATP-dependent DNA helicase RecG [Muribaculaceae bacterium]